MCGADEAPTASGARVGVVCSDGGSSGPDGAPTASGARAGVVCVDGVAGGSACLFPSSKRQSGDGAVVASGAGRRGVASGADEARAAPGARAGVVYGARGSSDIDGAHAASGARAGVVCGADEVADYVFCVVKKDSAISACLVASSKTTARDGCMHR